MTADLLRTDVHERVLTITIDRPEARGALTLAMRKRLEQLCVDVDADDAVDVVVLTGTGEAFCAGADIKEIAASTSTAPTSDPGAALRGVSKPVLCAVNGVCVTGGLEIALSCDIIVASERARFADTHAKLGVIPRWGMSALLPRRVGLSRAMELTATARFVDAREAQAMGLVDHVVPHDELAARVRMLAEAILTLPQHAVRGSFDLYSAGNGMPLDQALELERSVGAAFVTDLAGFREFGTGKS